MGSYMVVKVLIRNEKLADFLNCFGPVVLRTYDRCNGYVEVYVSDYYGYAEPVEMYHKFKLFVKDVWWLDLSCSSELVGRNMNTKWYSAKAEYIEEDWKDNEEDEEDKEK